MIIQLKEQAASITIAKVEEICKLIPALYHEIDWERGKSRKTTDFVEYQFKNGSKIHILPAKESSRGQRRTGRKKNILHWSFLDNILIMNFII